MLWVRTGQRVPSFIWKVLHGLQNGLFGGVSVEVPLDPRVSTVLSQTCTHTHTLKKKQSSEFLWTSGTRTLLTDPGLVELHREGPDQVLQEGPDQPEVDAPDAPGAVHQDHDVRYGRGLAGELVLG